LFASFGLQTVSIIAFGGEGPPGGAPQVANCGILEWNSWTEVNDLNTARENYQV
jgi:hypothetical protein